jgi:hypothetical protein
LEDGIRVSAETSRRLACDASRVIMRHDHDGRIVEVGARTRTIPPALRSNLVLLCRRHHRAVHEEGYRVARGPDDILEFRRPDGHLLPDVPAAAAVPEDPVTALRSVHEAQGLHLHARTTCPLWLGERLDLGWAIGVLHPRAARIGGV